jgi:hypothetical protein
LAEVRSLPTHETHLRLSESLPVEIILKPGGGKQARHAWTESSNHLGNISYIGMQTYRFFTGSTFWAVHSSTTATQTFNFRHLSTDHLLRALSGRYTLSEGGRALTLNGTDMGAYRSFRLAQTHVALVVERMGAARRKRGRRNAQDTAEGDGEDVQ